MSEQISYKLRPLSTMCTVWCCITFSLAFITGLYGISLVFIEVVYISVAFVIINAILAIFSIWKWDSFVYIDNDKITQYQWGKEITIFYKEIDKVKYFKFYDDKRLLSQIEGSITIRSKGKKITFGELSVLPKFLEKCSSEKVKSDIQKAIEKSSKLRYKNVWLN